MFKEGDKGDKFYIILKGRVRIVLNYNKLNEDYEGDKLALLDDGVSFGELSLIKNQPRVATAVCEENTYFMVLTKEDYMRLLGKSFSRKLEEKIEFLHGLKVFEDWSKKSIEKLTFFFKYRIYKKKEIFYAKNDEVDGAFIIVSGEIELTTECECSNSNHLPKNLKIAIISANDIFGDEEILLNVPRKYTAHCKSDIAEVFWISKEDFLTKIGKDSLKQLVIRNYARNNIREYRIRSVERTIETNLRYSSTPQANKPLLKNSFSSVKRIRKKKASPSPNNRVNTKLMDSIKKRSGIQLSSPTVSIIDNCVVTFKQKNTNVFMNCNGFQPNQNFCGIFKKIHQRIRGLEF